MKTTCFLVTLFSAAVLVVHGAPANKGSAAALDITCPSGGDCTSTIEFDFSGLNPGTTYQFAGVNITNPDTTGNTFTAASDGTFSYQVAFLDAGTWEFTLTPEHKNGKLAHSPDIDSQQFDVP